ncbi:MAG: 1-acyl-sn-glycerol-3-phosphate acyltransferase [Sphaerochaetaceae bacterium]
MQDIFPEIERFDMALKPIKTKWYLMPLVWVLSFPAFYSHKVILKKTNIKGLKPPYILLCNHNAFMDFKVASVALFPKRANYVVAIDGFWKREKLLRNVGCLCKRKFTSDFNLVRNLQYVIKQNGIAVIYPEARYSLCGTNAILPSSLGKLARYLKVPVVTLICHGHHINTPFWNLRERKLKHTEAEMKLLIDAKEIKTLSLEEINERINSSFTYDDYSWQKEKGVKVTVPWRAENLHKVLYKCPHCNAEYKMNSKGTKLYCTSCKKEWEYTELGELKAVDGEDYFTHIPSWYEWERKEVRKEIDEGTYSFSSTVHTMALPDASDFIEIGKGTLSHDINGFAFSGKYNGVDYSLKQDPKGLYSVHIEFDYLGKFGDCIDLNTMNDTFYIFPEGEDFSVTKISLAVEEIYKKLSLN